MEQEVLLGPVVRPVDSVDLGVPPSGLEDEVLGFAAVLAAEAVVAVASVEVDADADVDVGLQGFAAFD